jgi:hypothetical protein
VRKDATGLPDSVFFIMWRSSNCRSFPLILLSLQVNQVSEAVLAASEVLAAGREARAEETGASGALGVLAEVRAVLAAGRAGKAGTAFRVPEAGTGI